MTDKNNKDVRADKRAVAASTKGKMYKSNTPTMADLAKDEEAKLRKIHAETGAPRARAAAKTTTEVAGMAKGVSGRDAPHSAKSLADGRRSATKATPAAAKKVERKATKAATAAPKATDARKITIVDKKFTYGAEGTSRRASWTAATKAKTVADYAAAGGAVKYLPRWVAAGAIKLG